MRSCSTQVMYLYNPGRLYDESCPAQSPEIHSAECPILGLWCDHDLTRDLKSKILSTHLKRLVAGFRLPHRPSRCGHWFSSYQQAAFNTPPPPASGGWRNMPATAGLTLLAPLKKSGKVRPLPGSCAYKCGTVDLHYGSDAVTRAYTLQGVNCSMRTRYTVFSYDREIDCSSREIDCSSREIDCNPREIDCSPVLKRQ